MTTVGRSAWPGMRLMRWAPASQEEDVVLWCGAIRELSKGSLCDTTTEF